MAGASNQREVHIYRANAKTYYNKINMSKIEDLSIFGEYKQTENRVTTALLQILKVGGTDFVRYVISTIDEIDFPSNDISIITQKKEVNNIYDGLLACSFAFRVIVESKIKKETINNIQLKGLLENAKSPNDYILYITPDNQKLPKLNDTNPKIYWANWRTINEILKDYIKDDNNNKVLEFLIAEFEKFLDGLNLLEVEDPSKRVQIAAGSWGEPIALEYGFYACQNNRSVKKSCYLSFYNNRKIQYLFKIVNEPINDFDLTKSTNPNVIRYLTEKKPNYKEGELCQFYELKRLDINLEINHTGKTKSGKNSAFTMGVFRYTSIDKIKRAKNTTEL